MAPKCRPRRPPLTRSGLELKSLTFVVPNEPDDVDDEEENRRRRRPATLTQNSWAARSLGAGGRAGVTGRCCCTSYATGLSKRTRREKSSRQGRDGWLQGRRARRRRKKCVLNCTYSGAASAHGPGMAPARHLSRVYDGVSASLARATNVPSTPSPLPSSTSQRRVAPALLRAHESQTTIPYCSIDR